MLKQIRFELENGMILYYNVNSLESIKFAAEKCQINGGDWINNLIPNAEKLYREFIDFTIANQFIEETILTLKVRKK